jgi:Methyltransferase domain
MNDLETYFYNNTGRMIHKWRHYFEIYDRHFSQFRNEEICVVEFGVFQGGSLQMWKDYFGKKARIVGVDINPECKKLEEDQIDIVIGDQDDRTFLRSLAQSLPRINILIDDGGHTMRQQINTFEELYPHVHDHGVYLCEDLLTSYWPSHGGGWRRKGTFIEFSKGLIDDLHAWHSQQRKFRMTDFTRTTHSIHFYDNVVVIEKRPIEQPDHLKTGKAEIANWKKPKTLRKRIKKFFRRKKRT